MVDVLAQLIEFRRAALDILFPQFCIGCGKAGAFLCHSCLQSLPYLESPVCPRCGRPQIYGELCRDCCDWHTDIDGIRAPFRFEGIIRSAIHELKYHNLRAISRKLAEMMSEYLKYNSLYYDIIIPVPLHTKRFRERGYNQSALLAREMGKILDLPVDERSLIRNKYILPQARTVSVEERRQNVIGVFYCHADRLQDKRVLLIDDVATSGATMDACATVLKSAGAITVWGLALAREI